MDYLKRAASIIDLEIRGLQTVKNQLDSRFCTLIEKCLTTFSRGGKVVICGVGKSGYIGHKIASTLVSTGSPAAFLHPVEAMHGDLGILHRKDIFLALSYSGETEELLALLPSVKRCHVPIVCLTGNADSQLAQWSDIAVITQIKEEACPFNLAPTTSTTAMLALGDALAILLLEARGFSKEDYGKLHPAGSIGRSVTLRVQDIMRTGYRLPTVSEQCDVKGALVTMTRCRSGSVLIIDKHQVLRGIFTDGDFRRQVQDDPEIFSCSIENVMTTKPVTILPSQMAIEVLRILERKSIDDIPVVDDQYRAIGLVDIQDLAKFKMM